MIEDKVKNKKTFPIIPDAAKKGVVVIGNFDGAHKGHQELIASARQKCDKGQPLVVMTFDPHPRIFFQSNAPEFRLSNINLKTEALKQAGADHVFAFPFDQDMAALSPRDFVERYIVGTLKAQHVFIGYDFHFGHQRSGTPETMAELSQEFGFELHIMAAVKHDENRIYSSSLIRSALQRGDIKDAERLLGHHWCIEAEVVHGDKRGRELGYPTANMHLDRFIHPAYGIYAMRVRTEDGTWHKSVANFGIRPMFATQVPLLEAHLIDFDGDLYGQILRVEWVDYIRPEENFDDINALIRQMDQDKARALEILN